jgi:hypothetical protein
MEQEEGEPAKLMKILLQPRYGVHNEICVLGLHTVDDIIE